MIADWPCPLPSGGHVHEMALAFEQGRAARVLIIPALFDEGNRLRRFTVEVMRRLDGAGIDCFLPDLPGTNESIQALENQTPRCWQEAMQAAAEHFEASHVLAIRGGGLVMPQGLPGWRHAPVKGASILRQMIRARVLAAREAGREETQDALLAQGLRDGLELAGYRLSAPFIEQLQVLDTETSPDVSDLTQASLGGPGLWLRAEADEDRGQADALAAIVAMGLRA